MKKLLLVVALFLVTMTTFAHTWEIRVNQNQDGSLTWYIQSYHTIGETACTTEAYKSGLIINGVTYPIQSVHTGDISTLSPTVFGRNTSCGTRRNIYGIINTPFLGNTLNVQPYSNVACWANCNISAVGNFTPPPPPVCTSCPLTGWSNTMAASGNNNGTPCDLTDDVTTTTVTVNHLSCANITGDKQFRLVYDPSGANISYGPFNYSAGVQTNVTINVPYGTTSSTPIQVIDDDFPCQITHGLTIPGGQYTGEKENVRPVISCVANMSVGMDQGTCSAVVNYALPTYSDNCGVATIQQTAGLPSGSVFPKGNTTNTFVVTDPSGNTATCSFTVTVSDDLAPIAVCKNISIPLNADLTAGITVTDVNNNSYDNCGPVVVVISSGKTQFDCSDIGKTYPVTILVTDQQGLTSSCTAQVTVTDPNSYCNQPPVAVCKALTLSANGNCQATAAAADFNNGSSDPNGDAITFSISPAGPYNFGTTNVTLTVTDSKGASSTCETTVTVIDDTKPTITAPAAISVNNDAGKCGAVVALGSPTTADNCGVATTTNNTPATFPVGTTTVTWTVTDIHGNSATATQTVTVTDAENPVVVTKPTTVTLLPNGSVSITASMVDGGSTDNCGIASTSVSPSIFYCKNIGANTVTLTVTDIYGHVSTGTAVVTVIGEIPGCSIKSVPTSSVFTGGNPNNLYLGYGAQSTTLQVTPVGASGNGGPTYTYTYSWAGASNMLSSATSGSPVFTPTAAGSYTFTVTTTNNYGCVTTCSISICVSDIRVPGTNGSKVYVCHLPPGNPGNPQTLSISVNAVPAHLGNHTGDKLGTCDQKPCTSVTVGTNATQASGQGIAKDGEANDSEESFTVKVSPNPSTNFFTLKLESKFETPVSIVVMDVTGRVIDAKSKIASNSTIQIGQNYISGKYYAEIIQGTTHKTVQLMKVK